MDFKSLMGYANGSPFAGNPYLDIQTPEGLIDMSNTPIDLLGIDDLGNVKKMKAGSKNPYKFAGNVVREIPMQLGGFGVDSTLNANRQVPFVDRIINADRYPSAQVYGQSHPSTHLMMQVDNYAVPQLRYLDGKWINNTNPTDAINAGDAIKFKNEADALYFTQHYKESNLSKLKGNLYRQRGGMTNKQLFDFIFDDEDEEPKKAPTQPTAPSADEVEAVDRTAEIEALRKQQMDNFVMDLISSNRRGNPYSVPAAEIPEGNPYIKSSGRFGNQNVGQYGREIYGELSRSLGYAPVANSIYRSREQQNQLIASGAPAAKNSWHLTGNAIDLKPTDWHSLSDEQQQYFRNKYDVVYHNNHYHIEPRN